ncbi:anhydro-N-acetylmuramic acid kinase [Rathayibacter soli]|uniref:anhydro-N-acetylmuramic acid kinase n=1 Tax=Rathayibacter soli TaxID=3144168 RepID=UPI0027E472BE|nr:anhydro-N-acetylmuramic acid kinase [Glaciibacter superstes]
MRVLGMISGTSHDGIDVAVVDFSETGGDVVARIEYTATTSYSPELRARLLRSLPPATVGFEVTCELDTVIGQAFAEAAAAALRRHSAAAPVAAVDLVCSHGQTVFHWVEEGRARGTLQLGQPAWIAEKTQLPVVSNVRAADIAAGGQGAPLVPILDQILLSPYLSHGMSAAALNLGGIANITVCAPDADPRAWDIGPANALIDAVVTASTATTDTFDRDGALAASGAVHPALLGVLLDEPFYALPAPKSSGKELFHLEYLKSKVAQAQVELSFSDLVATVTELTARTVADAVQAAHVKVLVVSGGGVRNPTLIDRIVNLLPHVEVLPSDDLGVSSDGKEAVAFALIGWATAHGLSANVPSCTGASGPRVLGSVTPSPVRSAPMWSALDRWPRVRFEAGELPDRA